MKATLQELIDIFQIHWKTGWEKTKRYPDQSLYYEGYADGFEMATRIIELKLEKEEVDSTPLNLGATTGICCKCGTTKDVKFSPYDFFPYCEKHRPSVDPDKVIKTSPKMDKHL